MFAFAVLSHLLDLDNSESICDRMPVALMICSVIWEHPGTSYNQMCDNLLETNSLTLFASVLNATLIAMPCYIMSSNEPHILLLKMPHVIYKYYLSFLEREILMQYN